MARKAKIAPVAEHVGNGTLTDREKVIDEAIKGRAKDGKTKRKDAALESALGAQMEGQKSETITIKPLRRQDMLLRIVGVSPFMQLRFSQKSIEKIRKTQEGGSQSKSKKNRDKRDFNDDFEQAKHKFPDGSCGVPASAFRAAAISACRLVGYKMTIAKMSIFIVPDGYDLVDSVPLVRIEGKPEINVAPVRNFSGVIDLRARPLWKEWALWLKCWYDTDQFSASDVINLFTRVGSQVGIGEGRADSRESCGLGYGEFRLDLDKCKVINK